MTGTRTVTDTTCGEAGRGDPRVIEHARLWLPLGHDELVATLPLPVRRMVAVARACGAPVDPTLAVATEVERQRADTAAELARVVRPAVAVARGLAVMPVVVVPLLAWVLDLDLVAFFAGDPVGRVVGLVVVVMVVLAITWLWLLVVAATSPPKRTRGRTPWSVWVVAGIVLWLSVGIVPALLLGVAAAVLSRRPADAAGPGVAEAAELAATAASAGLALPAALRVAARHLVDDDLRVAIARCALQLELSPPAPTPGQDRRAAEPATGPRGEFVALCRDLVAAGRPTVAPLRRLARRLRAEEAAARRVAVARLPGRLTFPTALLLVPATVMAIGTPIAMRGLAVAGGL